MLGTAPDMRDPRDRAMVSEARQALLSKDPTVYPAMVKKWTVQGWSKDRQDGFILAAQALAERGTSLEMRAAPKRHYGKAGEQKPISDWSASAARFTADKWIRFGSDK